MSTRRNILRGLASLPFAGLVEGATMGSHLPVASKVPEMWTLPLVTKWHKILEHKYYGEEHDFENRDYCWPLEYGNAEPNAIACALEMQRFEDQYLIHIGDYINVMSLDEWDHWNELRWHDIVIKNVIPWIRRRYSGNVHPLASCQYELSSLQLDIHPVVPHVFPWKRTGKVINMSYQDSKSITEPDIFYPYLDDEPSLFEQHAIELLTIK